MGQALGHRFILEQFGVVPRIGWQIDPFGHSAVPAKPPPPPTHTHTQFPAACDCGAQTHGPWSSP